MESMSPIPPDPYEALGLSKDCKPSDVKLAYRKLVLKWHPDKVPEHLKEKAQDEFHKVQQAYEILSDDDKRKHYDASVRLAELRRINLEMRSANAGLRVDTRTTAGYETRTAVPSSAVPPRGPVRSYTTDERTRPSYYSDEDIPRSSARRPEYSYVRRSPREKESDREREKARQKEKEFDERTRRDEDRRRADKLRDTERGYDRSAKSDRFREEEAASRDADRRRRERDAPEPRRPSYRDETDDKQSRAESYIASSRRPAATSRTSSSQQFAYVRSRQPAESSERSPPRDRDRPTSSRRDPQIVDDRRRDPPPLRKNYSEPDPLVGMAEKPDVHRSYTTQTDSDRRRRTSLDDEDRTPSLPRSTTMPTQSTSGAKVHAPSRLRESETISDRYTSTSGPRIKTYSVDPNLGATLREPTSSVKDSSYRTTIREPTSGRSASGPQRPSLSTETKSSASVAQMMANLSPSTRTPTSATSSKYSPYEDRRPAYVSTESSRNVRASRSPERDREPRRSRADERPLYGEIRGTPIGTPSYVRDPNQQSYFDAGRSGSGSGSYSRRFAEDEVRYSEARPRASRDNSYNDGRPSLSRSSTAVY